MASFLLTVRCLLVLLEGIGIKKNTGLLQVFHVLKRHFVFVVESCAGRSVNQGKPGDLLGRCNVKGNEILSGNLPLKPWKRSLGNCLVSNVAGFLVIGQAGSVRTSGLRYCSYLGVHLVPNLGTKVISGDMTGLWEYRQQTSLRLGAKHEVPNANNI